MLKYARLFWYAGTTSSAVMDSPSWRSAPMVTCSVAPPPCLTLPSCGGFCRLYEMGFVPLTLVLSEWATSFLMQPSLSVLNLLCWCRQVPGRHLEKGSTSPLSRPEPLSLAGRHCPLLLGEHCTLLSSLHGKSILQVRGVITTCLGETLLALI